MKLPSRKTLSTVLISVLSTLLLVGLVFLFVPHAPSGSNKLSVIYQLLSKHYYQETDTNTMMDGAAKGLADSLGDPYTVYMTKEEAASFDESITGKYFGIGLSVRANSENNQVVVSQVFAHSPAQKAGLAVGDILIQVNDLKITAENMSEAVSDMRGTKEGSDSDSPVSITYRRNSVDTTVQVERADIVMDTVVSARYQDIEYIAIRQFEEKTGKEMEAALKKIDVNHTRGLILDLRDNPGGLIDAAVSVCDQLLPKGTVVYIEDKHGNRKNYTSKDGAFSLPLAVLVNEETASAAEIVSGAVQDYKRGTLIGTTTFGKGIVQNVFPFSDGSALKVTTARYFTPSGTCIHGTGITPDQTVTIPEENLPFDPIQFDLSRDLQMKAAISLLQSQE